MQQQLVKLVGQGLRLGQIGDPDGPARDLVLVGRPDAASGGADLAIAARRLARPVERRMHRQDQRRVLGDPQRVRRHVDTLCPYLLDLGQQRLGIDDHAVADDADLAAHQARGQQRQLVGLACRPPSVWPALWPPWKRTTMSARLASQSTTFPLPSSPHWAPITATFAMHQVPEVRGTALPLRGGCVNTAAGAPRLPDRRPAQARRSWHSPDAACAQPRRDPRRAERRAVALPSRSGAARSTASGNRVRPVAGSASPQI